MIRRPPRSTLSSSSAASDVYKRQRFELVGCPGLAPLTAPEDGNANATRHAMAIPARYVLYLPNRSNFIGRGEDRVDAMLLSLGILPPVNHPGSCPMAPLPWCRSPLGTRWRRDLGLHLSGGGSDSVES